MGKGKIFLIRDGVLQKMSKEKYDEEQKLQQQIEDYHDLIPGEQIDPEEPRRWLLIEREAGIQGKEGGGNRWSLDHLFLDQDGVPTLVEVKRQQDTRSRRRVVAQMLDYAANTTRYWKLETIQEKFRSKLANPEERLSTFLEGKASTGEFWQNVENNLDRGKIRLLFIADEIPTELKSIVEFLNIQMSPAEVLAVELGHYAGSGEEALVPRVIGQTESARQKKSSSSKRRDWDWDSMLKHSREKLTEEEVKVIKDLYKFGVQEADEVYFGSGAKNATFMVKWEDINDKQTFKVSTNGKIEFNWLTYILENDLGRVEWGEDELNWLFERLSEIVEGDLPLIEEPYLSLEEFTDKSRRNKLESIILDFVERCS
ncbi:hypothetical protein KGY79_10465 [Candidatus Bipolaricaulota bacterium]|nr:hypothetical protein [Candidatus Bipolaricaulota bacterium]